MKVSQYIAKRIKQIPNGKVFTYDQFLRAQEEKEAVIKALNRMVQKDILAKLSRGRYYKPETTIFGTLSPPQEEVIKDLLNQNKKQIGYLTGLSIYPELGLTTQLSNTIQIGKNDFRPAFTRGRYSISIIRQKNQITRASIPFLQILDAIRYIKKIPDAPVIESCIRIKVLLGEISKKEVEFVISLAQKYPPATRALLGAILESNGIAQGLLLGLKNSLNPITNYNLLGLKDQLKTAANWNIE